MKSLLFVFALTLLATPVLSSPFETNTLGFYLDPTGTLHEGPVAQCTVYTVLKNPTFTAVNGVEFGFEVAEGSLAILSTDWPPEAIAIGGFDGTRGNWATGFAPIPTYYATVVCTMEVLPAGPCTLRLGPNVLPSDDPDLPAVLVDGVVTNVAIAAGCADFWHVGLGIWCPLPVEAASFDRLKSLYR